MSLFVRLTNFAFHSWLGSLEHFHQNSLLDPATTWSGVTPPFLAGCHSAAISGKREARLLVIETLREIQKGQLKALLVR
jgi:hypothetical protein